MKKDDYSRLASRITTVLFATQSLTSAAFIVSGAVSAIVGAQLVGDPAWAGVPAATQKVGSAVAALVIGAVMSRLGRRWGLTLGLAVGVLGAGLSVGAIIASNFPLFLVGLLFMGVASAANGLSRFAAAEVHPQHRRGRTISYVVAGGTVGAIVGPLLAGPAGHWALVAKMDELTGPFVAAAVLLGLASLTVFIWLRPEPRDIGKKIAEMEGESSAHQGIARPQAQILRQPETVIALSAMVGGQMVMAMLMGITSLHMMEYQHDLEDISLVISAHTLGMFAFSVFVGRLTDRWGRGPVIVTGAALLVLAGLLAPLSTAVLPLAVALLSLGLGWNLCYVGGSALLADQLSPAERANTQGTNDLFIGLATAAASLSGGLLLATIGFAGTGIVGALISIAPLGLAGWWMIRPRSALAIRL
jgi:MFS family permease